MDPVEDRSGRVRGDGPGLDGGLEPFGGIRLVFDLYTTAQDYLRTVEEIDAMTDRLNREQQGEAWRGVALTPEN